MTRNNIPSAGILPALIGLAIGASLLAGCQATFTQAAASPTNTPTATSLPPGETATATTEALTPTESRGVILDFVERVCEAEWSNSGQSLACPGDNPEIIGSGYVGVWKDPRLEDFFQLQGDGLLTHPAVTGQFGGIFGAYPPLMVEAGDQFRATIGCLSGIEARSCNVQFALEYYDSDGRYHSEQETGWRWEESYDGSTTNLAVDLSVLAGENTRFVLTVRDNGDPLGDYAIWFMPQIWRGE